MKKYTRVSKEINGKVYEAQFNGISAALKAVDNTYIDGTNTTSIEKMANYLIKNVLVEPKLESADDFEDINELNEVVSFLTEVNNGTFREETNESTANTKGKK